MSERIKVGDLVQVIKPGCNDKHLGYTFVVNAILPSYSPCPVCRTHHGVRPGDPVALEPGDMSGFELHRLKRIPDFPELADERHDEEITA